MELDIQFAQYCLKKPEKMKYILPILVVLTSVIGSLANTYIVSDDWYTELIKSPLNPPSYVFGIIWPVLYFLMAISTYLVWTNPKCYPYCEAITYFNIQLFFNLIWTTIFFKYKRPKLALLDIILIIAFTVITYFKYKQISYKASLLLLPYLIWLSVAFMLNLYIVIYN